MRPARLLQIGLSAFAAFLLIYLVDWREVGRIVAHADPWLLLLCIALYAGQRMLMAGKWALLLRVHRVRLPLVPASLLYSATSFLGMILPSTVGADALRITWLWRAGVDPHDATASVAVERLIGALVTFGAALLGLAWLQRSIVLPEAVAATIPAVVVVMGVIAAGLAFSWLTPNVRLFRIGQHHLVGRLLHRFAAAWERYGRRKDILAAFAGLTLVECGFSWFMGWMTARALGIEVGFVDLAGAYAVSLAITRLPITIEGIGVYEALMVFILGAVAGMAAPSAVALVLAGRILFILVQGLATILFFLREGRLSIQAHTPPLHASTSKP